ncbi:uncharacterized protein LOC141885656 isoform X4 [Acropora palmata]
MERNGTQSKVDCLLNHLPPKVKDFSWEIQNEFSKSLNPPKKSGCDWRKVASRLDFSKIIPELEKKENPTIELLRECTETTTEMLLRILVEMGRSDVLDDILKSLDEGHPKLLARFSTQESLNDSFASSLFLPLQHSGDKSVSDETDLSTATLVPQECDEAGRGGSWLGCQVLPAISAVFILELAANSGSSRMSRAPQPPRTHKETKSKALEQMLPSTFIIPSESFLSDESQNFWVNIAGDNEQKKWPDFFQAARNCCPTEMQRGNMENFLCKILKIDYGQLPRNDRHVTRNGFLELVALFGPFKPGPDGCLQKMCDLMKDSTSRQGANRER